MSGKQQQQVINEELTCKPLDSYYDILQFLDDPPPWRSLCKELTPHSQSKIKNIEINKHYEIDINAPETFCHFNPDAEDPIRYDGNELPRTLVCHDMANGYADDCYIDGTGHREAYNFYNWAGIDIFCYFSHHLITIPPLSWINVGHAHGVKVIGTVITEWTEGMEFWEEVLESETKYRDFASALVAIAKTLKFDGWLLNVENKIAKPDMLLGFVQHLSSILHEEIPHAELIWYDSVTISGHLNWQNGLNEKNRAFFDACDGIFTNYSWSEFDLTTSSIEAGDRIKDLYIGIDVWGRNFHGGGEFNTQTAIKLVYEQGCSLAIFAPAWTHEALADELGDVNAVVMGDQLDRSEQFRLRDRALWGSLWPFLNTTLPCTLPFQTSFCRGQGKKRRIHGEVICPGPWYNLRHQQYQTNSAHGPHGYMLSSPENILAVSRLSMFKDHKGIIRYRDSFLASRVEQHSTSTQPQPVEPHYNHDSDEPRRESDEHVKESDEPRKESDKPKVTVSVDSTRKSSSHAGIGSSSVKSKMKRVLKMFFGSTSSKKSDDTENKEGPAEVKEEPAEPKPGPSNIRMSKSLTSSTGKSMVTMSVNLRLGQGSAAAKVRFGLAHVAQERECLQLWEEDSYNGGACLRVHPSDELCTEHRTTRLLHCEFPCRETLVACVVTKVQPEAPRQYLNVHVEARSARGDVTRAVLTGRAVPRVAQAARASAWAALSVSPLELTEPRFKALQRHLLMHQLGFYVPVENSFGWTVRYYEVFLPETKIVSINLRTGEPQGPILLGHFGLCHVNSASIESTN